MIKNNIIKISNINGILALVITSIIAKMLKRSINAE
jgi:hypothetical protein